MFDEITNRYMSIKQVADYLSVSEATINRWRKNDDFPKAKQFSKGCVRWRRGEIEDWEATRMACFIPALHLARRPNHGMREA